MKGELLGDRRGGRRHDDLRHLGLAWRSARPRARAGVRPKPASKRTLSFTTSSCARRRVASATPAVVLAAPPRSAGRPTRRRCAPAGRARTAASTWRPVDWNGPVIGQDQADLDRSPRALRPGASGEQRCRGEGEDIPAAGTHGGQLPARSSPARRGRCGLRWRPLWAPGLDLYTARKLPVEGFARPDDAATPPPRANRGARQPCRTASRPSAPTTSAACCVRPSCATRAPRAPRAASTPRRCARWRTAASATPSRGRRRSASAPSPTASTAAPSGTSTSSPGSAAWRCTSPTRASSSRAARPRPTG